MIAICFNIFNHEICLDEGVRVSRMRLFSPWRNTNAKLAINTLYNYIFINTSIIKFKRIYLYYILSCVIILIKVKMKNYA